VLIADHDVQRATVIKGALTRQWKAPVTIVHTQENAFQAAEDAEGRREPCQVVMVPLGFGDLGHSEILRRLCRGAGTKGILIDDQPDRQLPGNAPVDDVLIVPKGTPPDDSALLLQLRQIMGARPQRPPTMSNAGRIDAALRLQIRWLDSRGRLDEGKEVLCDLVSQLLPGIKSFEIHRLGQGFSGAKVFRLSYPDSSSPTRRAERILKLTPAQAHQAWKCRHEVRNYPKIAADLGGVLPMIPELKGIPAGSRDCQVPAENETWLAVMYAFLGGHDLVASDFDQAYLDPATSLSQLRATKPFVKPPAVEAALAQHVLARLLERLEEWYGRRPFRRALPLWSTNELEEGNPLKFPPFAFRLWEKSKIIESLDALQEYGVSLSRAQWKAACDTALRCIGTGRKLPKQLDCLLNPQPTLLTPVHGDLNAKNVLFALDRGQPFLIDFACYQSEGHNLQDFARLEVAVKMELMGREVGAPEGKDLDINSFPIWCDAEDWLSGWPDDDSQLCELAPDNKSVQRAYALCWQVRKAAGDVHRRILRRRYSRSTFRLSYNAALLYHTLRAIGYDSLPHLKRLFAVYSARAIVQRIGDSPRG